MEAPTVAPTAALAGVAGVVDAGAHAYAVANVGLGGRISAPSPISNSVTTSAGNGQVNLTNIPTAPQRLGVTGRMILRYKAGGNTLFVVTTIADNVTTTYTDNATDASLAAFTGSIVPATTVTVAQVTALLQAWEGYVQQGGPGGGMTPRTLLKMLVEIGLISGVSTQQIDQLGESGRQPARIS